MPHSYGQKLGGMVNSGKGFSSRPDASVMSSRHANVAPPHPYTYQPSQQSAYAQSARPTPFRPGMGIKQDDVDRQHQRRFFPDPSSQRLRTFVQQAVAKP